MQQHITGAHWCAILKPTEYTCTNLCFQLVIMGTSSLCIVAYCDKHILLCFMEGHSPLPMTLNSQFNMINHKINDLKDTHRGFLAIIADLCKVLNYIQACDSINMQIVSMLSICVYGITHCASHTLLNSHTHSI